MTEAWKQCEGQVVDGKFHLRQYLGGSDHSAVFLTEIALQLALKAAIKFIPADGENSETQISRWQLAAKLSHPHLIQILDAGRCQLGGRDLLFVVTEYAEENLAQILPHRALTSEEAQDMLPPVLDVLSYIHGQGLVHGHMKPSNIMAVQDQLRISSDGLSAAGEPGKKLLDPSLYNAPEIATGMTPASDVWSLGMTLVEVLTQRPLLWDGRGEPVVPETVPPPFRNMASHCLRQNSQLRWTIAEIAAGLNPPVNGVRKQPAAASSRRSPSGLSSRPLTKSRFIGPIAAVVVLLLAIVGGSKLLKHQSQPQQSSAPAAPSPGAPSSNDSVEMQKPVVPETAKVPVTAGEPAKSGDAARPLRRSDRASKNPASDSARGSVVQQVLPAVSASARHTIEGRIRVRVGVDVDASGSVVEAKFESAGPSKYFSNKTMDAARQWKFAPPQINGRPAASVWVLKFAIGRTSTTVQPTQIKP
jgi:TonB family protein